MKSDPHVTKVEGRVEEALPNTFFRVVLDDKREVLARLAGRLGRFRIRVVPGDRVVVEMTSYDERRGRIIRRL